MTNGRSMLMHIHNNIHYEDEEYTRCPALLVNVVMFQPLVAPLFVHTVSGRVVFEVFSSSLP